jgi:hypothetical protein
LWLSLTLDVNEDLFGRALVDVIKEYFSTKEELYGDLDMTKTTIRILCDFLDAKQAVVG